MAVTASASVTNCPLFNLSGELRNVIWRMTVVQDEAIPVNRTGFAAPSLLLTCKVIRSKVDSIFFAENSFDVIITDYDCKPTMRMTWLTNTSRLHFTIAYQPNTENLRNWLFNYHTGAMKISLGALKPDHRLLFMPRGRYNSHVIIKSTFATLDITLTKNMGWHEVDNLLQPQFEALRAMDKD